jgi:hypothetical protein
MPCETKTSNSRRAKPNIAMLYIATQRHYKSKVRRSVSDLARDQGLGRPTIYRMIRLFRTGCTVMTPSFSDAPKVSATTGSPASMVNRSINGPQPQLRHGGDQRFEHAA